MRLSFSMLEVLIHLELEEGIHSPCNAYIMLAGLPRPPARVVGASSCGLHPSDFAGFLRLAKCEDPRAPGGSARQLFAVGGCVWAVQA